MNYIITGDENYGTQWFNENLCYPGYNYHTTKWVQLLEFGIPEKLLSMFEANPDSITEYGCSLEHVVGMLSPGLDRMDPNGCTRLGLYAKSIGDLLSGHAPEAEIVDFGCGPWVDASIYFASRMNGPIVKLIDIAPIPLAFSSFMLNKYSVKNEIIVVEEDEDSSIYVWNRTAMIIESTAFEHVVDIRHLFPKLMEALPSGALFLTNYTRADWTNPIFDGHQENKDYAVEAVKMAMDLAYRCTWEPKQVEGLGWDVWVRR